MPRSCSHLTLVSPRRNHSSSPNTDRVWIFFVVTSGKPVAEVEPHLVAEDAQGAGAGAVALLHALVEDPLEEIEVLPHGSNLVRGLLHLEHVDHERDSVALPGMDGGLPWAPYP